MSDNWSSTIQSEVASEVFRVLDRQVQLSHDGALKASGAQVRESGHPDFEDLLLGQSRSATIASLFLDLSDFTGRTFWDDPAEVAELAHSVLSGFALVVRRLGGHVLGLRGDGLFAGFGPHPDGELMASLAGLAAAVSVDAVRTNVNEELKRRGVAPLNARAGIDVGQVTFMRSGISSASEVNVIGFSANFAAKAEKIANAWEIVVGEGFMECLPDSVLISPHPKSPKPYQRDGAHRTYKYGFLHGHSTIQEYRGAAAEIAGRSLAQLGSGSLS